MGILWSFHGKFGEHGCVSDISRNISFASRSYLHTISNDY